MDWCPVNGRKPSRYLYGLRDLAARDRAHRDHHRAVKYARWPALHGCPKHGHHAPTLEVPKLHPGLNHDVLEREAASQEKPNEIVGPIRLDRLRFIDQLPMPIDAVPRQVGAQIGSGRGEAWHGGTKISYVQNRAWFRIAHAEQQEVVG